MAASLEIVEICDSNDESVHEIKDKSTATIKDAETSTELMECPICLQNCIHPARLPCGHIFCFLCVKGVAYKNRRCAMCRSDIPPEFLDHPQLVNGIDELKKTLNSSEEGFQWFYEGRNGWWQYDERTSQELEEAYKKSEESCSILVAGLVYTVDFSEMLQSRKNDPSRQRRVKRDLATIPKKGVAGLRIDGNNTVASSNIDENHTGSGGHLTDNLISPIAVTDAAIRIASDIIDSTLAHAHSEELQTNDAQQRNTGINNSSGSSGLSRSSLSNLNTSFELLDHADEILDLREISSSTTDLTNSINTNTGLFAQTIEDFRNFSLRNVIDTSEDSEDDNEPPIIL